MLKIRDVETLPIANCPHCGYSVRPTAYRGERKHFNAHAFECDRCAYRTETFRSFHLAAEAWDRANGLAPPHLDEALELIRCLIDNDPDADAADAVTVLDVWRKDAEAFLKRVARHKVAETV